MSKMSKKKEVKEIAEGGNSSVQPVVEETEEVQQDAYLFGLNMTLMQSLVGSGDIKQDELDAMVAAREREARAKVSSKILDSASVRGFKTFLMESIDVSTVTVTFTKSNGSVSCEVKGTGTRSSPGSIASKPSETFAYVHGTDTDGKHGKINKVYKSCKACVDELGEYKVNQSQRVVLERLGYTVEYVPKGQLPDGVPVDVDVDLANAA